MKFPTDSLISKRNTIRPHPLPSSVYVGLVMLFLALATTACMITSPQTLNDGRGTRENPVPTGLYAHTTNYDVKAIGVLWEQQNDSQSTSSQDTTQPLQVQFQIRCNEPEDTVCQLDQIGQKLKLLDVDGVLYDSVYSANLKEPLTGEILGGAEKTGWLAFQIPSGADITAAVAEYGEQQYVVFLIPQ
jgi:hypothetical protein